MNTNKNKHKIPYRNGDRALAKLIGGVVEAKQRAPVEQRAHEGQLPVPEPWALSDAVTVGIQGRDGFRAMNNMAVLPIPREYLRRFDILGEQMLRETAFALRAIMLCRMQCDFPGCAVTVDVVQPDGDICVSVDEGEGEAYLADPRVLQGRLDDACARFAACLGV